MKMFQQLLHNSELIYEFSSKDIAMHIREHDIQGSVFFHFRTWGVVSPRKYSQWFDCRQEYKKYGN